jgi:hypothetical protein
MNQKTKGVLVTIAAGVALGLTYLLPGAQGEQPKAAPTAVAAVPDAGAWGIKTGPIAAAAPAPKKQNKWDESESTDAMYGNRTVVGKLYSENSGDSLLIECHRGEHGEQETAVFYGVWVGAMPNEGRVPVLLKMGERKPRRQSWYYQTNGWYWNGTNSDAVGFLRQLTRSQTLVLEYHSALGERYTDTFDLEGSGEVVSKIANACGWQVSSK